MTIQLINIPFTKTDGVYKLQDALNLTQEEIDALGDAGIEAMKQQRFDNWVAFITAPSPEAEPETEEQIDG
jgi:hypothetical protein